MKTTSLKYFVKFGIQETIIFFWMARRITFVLLLLFLSGCIAKKKTTYAENRTVTVEASGENPDKRGLPDETAPSPTDSGYAASPEVIDEIITTALDYSGVRYKFGGTTKSGMDCSGLLYVAFRAHDIPLPRISYEMADEGRRIRVGDVEKGDLLFFKTRRGGKKINHVGLVIDVDGEDIKFIHSTSSRGVIVSSLKEGFWNYSFVKATRVL